MWDFEAIDTADSTDESGVFEMDPMNELKVGDGVQLKTIIKSVDPENEPTIWYAQVGINRDFFWVLSGAKFRPHSQWSLGDFFPNF